MNVFVSPGERVGYTSRRCQLRCGVQPGAAGDPRGVQLGGPAALPGPHAGPAAPHPARGAAQRRLGRGAGLDPRRQAGPHQVRERVDSGTPRRLFIISL